MSLCSIKVVLIPGLVGLPRREAYRVISIRPESYELAQQHQTEGLIRGVALEENNNVILMEFASKPDSVRTNFGVAWRKHDGDLIFIHFAKSYFNNLSTWHMAALASEINRINNQAETAQIAYVYNVEPIILGGNWKDISPSRSQWIKFQPYLKPVIHEIPEPKEMRTEVSSLVLQHLRDSGVSEGFIEDLIALRAQRIHEQFLVRDKKGA